MKDPKTCDHPEESWEIRRFYYAKGDYFAYQCMECRVRIRPRKLKPARDDFDPRKIERALPQFRRRPSRPGTKQGRDYRDRFKRPDWKVLRARTLSRDDFTCQHCGEIADQANHKTYDRFGHERLSDLEAVCGPCNLREREQRHTREALGS